ncbi:PREDICTED: syntaxin-binding protein 5 isoform X3 [Wasmannia auropunctata]|uniref:syntaxin-binding protein 5 isoform X3 n=1 Tax=Wasmannia auropunctata TaxID=64793 RepID=UPI0005EF128F|nr:PREDICTED: syntaxin-binding protein 5 isoform X3 [Wasmannia auropunctata]
MKKFTIKGVLDGFRSSVPQPAKPDQEIVENLRTEHFQVKKTFRHGFPHQPTALAFDPVQRLLAIGTKSGSLRILGRPGVDVHVKHEECAAVLRLQFLINEGALVSATEDDTLHLWNFRQKIPQVVHSLKFQRDRITCIHLPLQSKWLYIGTDRGNIHILHIETFVLSGYVINWNKAIEVSRKTHPGAVVHLSDNPLDLSKMLIGYSSGQIVLWDLKTKTADYRCQTDDLLTSITWHHEGKQFMCSHSDGSLSTWTIRQVKPSITFPHAKFTKDGEPERCKAIQKVEWKLSRSGEAYVIFSGGLAQDTTGRTPSITVIHGKTTTVLEMEHNVVDFITLCDSPWASDFQDPYAVVVLLQNDLVVIDLLTTGFPCFENPYPMDIHESPVTCCAYFADCPSDLVPAFYSVGSKSQKKTGFSEKEWPISGGEWSSSSSSYNEIILTGHADGSIKFWDASAGTLQVLYKLKTAKLFEKTRTRSIDNEEDPLAIQLIFLCPESRKLAIAGSGKHVVLFKFKKAESMSEVVTLEICLTVEPEASPDRESPATGNTVGNVEPKTIEFNHPLKVKTGLQKRPAGFQATLICLTTAPPGEQPENITSLSLNSSYGLLAYGNESGLVIVDIVQKISLIVLSTSDFGGGDPYQRVLRSPKRQDELKRENEDKARSPSTDQVQINFAVFPDSKVDSDKFDGSFQRSRSSSMSSLENITTETISCLTFADSYTKKSDTSGMPTLWIGTSLGSVQTVVFNTPAPSERHAHPVVVSTFNGSIFKLKGCILSMSFLDCNGALIPYSFESWKDENTDGKERNKSQGKCTNSRMSPSTNTQVGDNFEDRQFVMLASEKQARVVALPSQNCVYRQQLAETHIVIKAEVTSLKDNVCLVCYVSNGHITTYSLPSLRPLIDVDFLPLIDLSFQTTKHGIVDPMLTIWGHQLFVNGDTDQIAKTLCFSNRGHGLYLSSPMEIQKFSVSSEFCGELTEMMGDLFIGHDMPEPPKESFFKGLFGGGSRSLDREELFGESSGRASRTVAKHIPGPNEALRERVSSATGEVNMAHQMVVERGEKLSQLEERTARMMSEAENFSTSAHGLMLKYKDKKWYQL